MSEKLQRILQIIILICLTLTVLFFLSYYKTPQNKTNSELSKLVIDLMSKCQDTGELSCYNEIAKTLIAKFDARDVLNVFEKNEQTPVFFEKCHTTLHFLGQQEYKKTKNVSESLGEGLPICFAGFYHGVLEEYMSESGLANKPEELKAVLPTLCDSSESGNKKVYNECLHGLGHALMYATDDDLPQSLKMCDSLKSESDRNWCYSGSFMENSTSSTNRDHPSKYLKKEDPLYPCNILDKKYLNMCYTLQSFYFGEISKYDWDENERLCLLVPEDYRPGCFNAIGQVQVGATQDLNKMKDNCDIIDDPNYRKNCYEGVVGALGQRYDDNGEKALMFCNTLVNQDEEKSCYDKIIIMSKEWIPDKTNLRKFCDQINLNESRETCLNSL